MRLSRAAAVAACLASSAAWAQPRRNPRPAPRPAPPVELVDVTVRAGETCAAIARRAFRNAARVDVIHQYNPTVCPTQRRLVAGMVLRLPRRLPPLRGPQPVAFLTAVNNAVEVQTLPTAQPRRGQTNDSLFRGTRVSTEAGSSAELSFTDDTQLRLYESTLVVILGDSSTRVRRTATARDTTLVNGSLRAFLGSLAHGSAATPTPTPTPVTAPAPARAPARPPRRPPAPRPTQVAINTAGGRAILRDGESQLTVEEGGRHATTLTVYRGSGQLRYGAQTVTVPEGFGARAAEGERIAPVHRLPLAPRWLERPARVLLAEGDRAVEGRYAAGEPTTPPGAPDPAEWRVQIARDEAFTAVVADARVPATVDRLAVPAVPAGTYFVRVSAFDAEHYEGPFGETATVSVVVPGLTDTGQPYRQSLSLPTDVRCALDGAALDAPPTLVDRLRAHTLRCAAEGDADHAAEMSLPALSRSPFRVIATLDAPDAAARRGQVRVRVVDRLDVPYAEGSLAAEARGGPVTAAAPQAGGSPGDWLVPVRWEPGAQTFRLRLAPEGGEAVDSAELALPAPPVAVAPAEGFGQRISLRAEGLYANMLSAYQRNDDATSGAYMGNAKAITHGLAGSLRLGFDLRRPAAGEHGVVLGLEVLGEGVLFPRSSGEPGMASMVGGGLRLTAYNGAVQPWAAAGAGVVFTGGLTRFGVDVGLGVDFRLSPAVSLGPVVRYVHVLELNDDPATVALDEDARMLQVGLGLTLRFPRGR